MQLFFSSILTLALITGASLSYAEEAPKTYVEKVKERHMCPLSIVNMELSGLIQIHKALADTTDAESAAKSAEQLEVLRKKVQGFDKMIEKLTEEEEKKLVDTERKMSYRFILLYKRCAEEGKRIIEAQYFNCEALKTAMHSYEFADIVIPPPAPEKPAEEETPAPAQPSEASAVPTPDAAPATANPDKEAASAPL